MSDERKPPRVIGPDADRASEILSHAITLAKGETRETTWLIGHRLVLATEWSGGRFRFYVAHCPDDMGDEVRAWGATPPCLYLELVECVEQPAPAGAKAISSKPLAAALASTHATETEDCVTFFKPGPWEAEFLAIPPPPPKPTHEAPAAQQ